MLSAAIDIHTFRAVVLDADSGSGTARISISNGRRTATRGRLKWARIGGSPVDAVRLWCLRARY